MENPLVVFVSSMIGELWGERRAIKEAIEAIPLTRPWIFEYTPASTDRLEESYLRGVRGCDIFILLLAHSISDPVRREWQIAVAHDKPCFVFLKDAERNPEAQAFVEQVDVKWAKFSTTDELRRQVQEAVIDELIKVYRYYRLGDTEVSKLAELREMKIFIDKRSGGVYFESGPVHIKGDVIGRDQIKTTHEVHFHGSVTGPVHAGSGDLRIDTRQFDLNVASLAKLFATLKQEVAAQAPPGMKTKALQKIESLEEAVTEDEPDLGMMESALNWFKKNLPQLAGAVASVIVHPIVGKVVEAAGELVAAEFKRRFGDLGRH